MASQKAPPVNQRLVDLRVIRDKFDRFLGELYSLEKLLVQDEPCGSGHKAWVQRRNTEAMRQTALLACKGRDLREVIQMKLEDARFNAAEGE